MQPWETRSQGGFSFAFICQDGVNKTQLCRQCMHVRVIWMNTVFSSAVDGLWDEEIAAYYEFSDSALSHRKG